MGGRVGLKGTDGKEILARAKELGATSVSPARTIEALREIAPFEDRIELVTYPFDMGEEEAQKCGLDPTVIGSITKNETTAADTIRAAGDMLRAQVDLILFAGGDGTARDVCESIGQSVPALGIPAGVKIHSAVFAINSKKAGELAVKYLLGEASLCESEVMDIDEQGFREGRLSARLYAYLKVPYERESMQPPKSAGFTMPDEKTSQDLIAQYVAEKMEDDCYYILCPGTTVKAVADKLGIAKTLLGVDLVYGGSLVRSDLDEQLLLKLIDQKRVKMIVSPIGRQGFIFGRGNLQISPAVIRRVGKENILVIATPGKLTSIGLGRPLLVDTGDDETDRLLSGYMRVITGYREEVVVKVGS
jgi:predicted polyphosphate/ATP-dependent NAD kinase